MNKHPDKKNNVRIRSRIFIKFSAIISLVLMVLFLVAGIILFKIQERILIYEKRQSSNLFTEYLAGTCALYIQRKSYFILEEITQVLQSEVNEKHEIVSFIVTDTAGNKLNPGGIDKSEIKLAPRYQLTEQEDCVYISPDGTRTSVGSIMVVYNLQSVYNNFTNIIRVYIIVVIATIMLLDAIIAVLVYVMIIKPLEKITKAADLIADGRYCISFDSLPNDEIGFLGDTLVNMAGRINTAFLHIENNKKEIQKVNENLELMVEQRTSELIHSEKMAALGQLVAGVAHEINTPIGICVTANSHMQNESNLIFQKFADKSIKQSDFKRFLDETINSTELLDKNLKKASNLIQSFKQVSVTQTNEGFRSFNIKEYIQEVLTILRPECETKNIDFQFECEDDIVINSYPGFFSQIVSNFVINSVMHGFENKDAGQITFEISKSDEALLFIYKDNGCGVPKEKTRTIFEPFFTTKRNQGGSGLGLHIVYNIVTQKLKGTIQCDSDTDRGVLYLISIPLKEK